jgi:hypothetical protein
MTAHRFVLAEIVMGFALVEFKNCKKTQAVFDQTPLNCAEPKTKLIPSEGSRLADESHSPSGQAGWSLGIDKHL